MNKVTYFDVEYANSKNKSICQIGIMCEDIESGDPYYPELNLYINPEDRFDFNCVHIHGIKESTVANEPSFPEIWKKIEKYFTNAVVIGHNVASSDLNALVRALKRYNLDIPELYYICTYELAKKFVPRHCVSDYSLSTLCEYFDIDIDSEHNAFDDACACADLFRTLIDESGIDPEEFVTKYSSEKVKGFTEYIDNVELRKSISEFYGIVRGFSIDNTITTDETAYIENWRNEYSKYSSQKEIADIVNVIDDILDDGVITLEEIAYLQSAIKIYLDVVSTSSITLATQILDGILKGITIDGEITEEECKNLRQWLYDNIYLSNHYPFDKAISLVDKVLEDGIVTKEEAEYMTSIITDILNPVDALKEQINSVDGKYVCLSGNFTYGSKSKVEEYITKRGGIIDKNVKKSTDILMIGNEECKEYSNGSYGTKVKKAIEYNEKGANISIIKESDFFASVK